MRKHQVLQTISGMALAVWLVAGLAGPLRAQTAGPRGQGPMYDPATEVTLKGTVEEVRQISGNRRWGGTHLTLRTDQGTIDVHVGPSWFLEKNKMSIAKGDSVEVTGSKVKFASGDALIAREIKKGGNTLTLRNTQGIPAWSGGPRGR